MLGRATLWKVTKDLPLPACHPTPLWLWRATVPLKQGALKMPAHLALHTFAYYVQEARPNSEDEK